MVDKQTALEARHLRRLIISLLIGGASAVLALLVKVQVDFWLALALGVLAVVGMAQAIRWAVRSRSQD